MRIRLSSIPGLCLLLLPLLVAFGDLGPVLTLALLVGLLLLRWFVTMAALMRPHQGPRLRLQTIPISHFVEKVRWSLDRLGVEYEEVPDVGILGVMSTGRTVPRLFVRTGRAWSSLGNSAEILRFLWGHYGAELGDRASFLEPTPEALALESRLDRYGQWLQAYLYHHLLPHRELCLHLWGVDDPRIPAWQRVLARLLFPLVRAFLRRVFRISLENHLQIVKRIEGTLERCEELLADGRTNLLGSEEPGFVDLTLAALSGPWLMPEEYGGGEAAFVRPDPLHLPTELVEDRERWTGRYPRVVAHIHRLYREERGLTSRN